MRICFGPTHVQEVSPLYMCTCDMYGMREAWLLELEWGSSHVHVAFDKEKPKVNI